MKYSIWPAHEHHLYALSPKRYIYCDGDVELVAETLRASRYAPHCIFARTLVLDRKAHAILGVSLMWPGVAHGWALISDESKRYPILFAKTFKRLIENTAQVMGLKRISLSVKDGYNQGHRFAEFLGFEKEGLMRNYNHDGSSSWLYARVF